MNNEQIGLALTILGMAAALIWLIIRLGRRHRADAHGRLGR